MGQEEGKWWNLAYIQKGKFLQSSIFTYYLQAKLSIHLSSYTQCNIFHVIFQISHYINALQQNLHIIFHENITDTSI